MKIENVTFLKSISIKDEKIYFDARNEVVFVWRSNVWKSSLLNTLFQKKWLVHTSSLPWKTRTANIFLINNKYYFTDMPWYGFAKMGREKRDELDSLISWYLEERKGYIKNVVMILDSKIGPQKADIDMWQYITELQIPLTVVLNKVDKLWNQDKQLSLKHTEEILFWQKIELVSAHSGEWIDTLQKYLLEKVKAK